MNGAPGLQHLNSVFPNRQPSPPPQQHHHHAMPPPPPAQMHGNGGVGLWPLIAQAAHQSPAPSPGGGGHNHQQQHQENNNSVQQTMDALLKKIDDGNQQLTKHIQDWFTAMNSHLSTQMTAVVNKAVQEANAKDTSTPWWATTLVVLAVILLVLLATALALQQIGFGAANKSLQNIAINGIGIRELASMPNLPPLPGQV